MAERVQVREIDDDEGRRLLRIVRRGTGVGGDLASGADGIAVGAEAARGEVAEVTFTSEDRVRDVLHNFNADGFGSLYPKYAGGRPRTFNRQERREIKKIAKSKPVEHGLPFSAWSLSKLTDFLVTDRRTPRGSTASKPSSPRCATSPWTAPTTTATKNKAA